MRLCRIRFMEHILVFIYILLLLSGGVGVFSMFLLFNRFRTEFSRNLLGVNILFSSVLFFNFVSVFLVSVFPLTKSVIRYLYPFSFILGSGMYAGIAYTLVRLDGGRKRLLFVSAAAIVGVMCFRLVLGVSGAEGLIRLFRLPLTTAISAYLFLIGWEMKRLSRGIGETSLSALCRNLGVFTVGFAVLSTVFYYVRAGYPLLAGLPISLDYLFFFVWNVISFSAYLHSLKNAPGASWNGELSAAFLEKFNITPREKEVALGIAQGKSNQEIADSLFVSFTTVRTHVYNIFQKTGAKSRMDLLRIIRDEAGDLRPSDR